MKTFTELREAIEKTVVILRGISGSGKSTYTKKHYPNAVVVSADHFFEKDGQYNFDRTKLQQAHSTCLRNFDAAVHEKKPLIVVDNTATKLWEFEKYLKIAKQNGYKIEVIRLVVDPKVAAARNLHGVPADVVKQMADRFEDYPSEKIVKND